MPRIEKSPKGWVYFIEAAGLGRIKIGYSGDNPMGRMATMQVGCPVWLELRAVVECKGYQEGYVHHWLVAYRIRGDWFLMEGPVLEALDAAISLMRPEHARWCQGGEAYEKWDRRRKSYGRTPDEIRRRLAEPRESLPAHMGTYEPPTMRDILLNGHEAKGTITYPEWYIEQKERAMAKARAEEAERVASVEAYWDRIMGRGESDAKPKRIRKPRSRKPKPPTARRVPGHFSLIDEHRAARKMTNQSGVGP